MGLSGQVRLHAGDDTKGTVVRCATYTMTVLLKVPLILAGIVAADTTYTPPIPPPKTTEITSFDNKLDAMSKLSRWMPTLFKVNFQYTVR